MKVVLSLKKIKLAYSNCGAIFTDATCDKYITEGDETSAETNNEACTQ